MHSIIFNVWTKAKKKCSSLSEWQLRTCWFVFIFLFISILYSEMCWQPEKPHIILNLKRTHTLVQAHTKSGIQKKISPYFLWLYIIIAHYYIQSIPISFTFTSIIYHPKKPLTTKSTRPMNKWKTSIR